ncbi:hypothetical protein [Paenibacillus sp. sgz500958]|uniref:hypothetical protein n=1 Tax=Paenibacillus sp. sgz500958 TaxID=3242475 RepID=UPI0036D3A197
MKKRISALMDTVSEMLSAIYQINDPISAVSDCLAAIEAMSSKIMEEDPVPKQTIEQLVSIHTSLKRFLDDSTLINPEGVTFLNDQLTILKDTFQDEIVGKLNIVFLPYKASMWDSLASIYEAALKDKNCVAHVVPIPYYQLTQSEQIPVYEGGLFPQDVPVIHYSQYNLQEQQPDIVYLHNIYDQYNTLTRVPEQFYTSNLKKYTDMLVYVPYHISSFIEPPKGFHSLSYALPSVANVDKVILIDDFLKKAAIREGLPEDKFLVLGSPKFDAMVKAIHEGAPYPEEWKERVEGKTVYLINTGCLFFGNSPFVPLERLLDFFNIPRIAENSIVIWRPHPLTKISIMKYAPHFTEFYINLIEKWIKGRDPLYNHIIFDETEDYMPALNLADVLISSDGSLLRSYLLTEKKVLFWGEGLPKGSLIPDNVFYQAFDRSEPWYELVKKFAAGHDPLADNRKGVAAKVYTNVDGTAGEKVHYVIKKSVLEESLKSN